MSALTADMKQVVERQRLAYVATVCADGTPNVSPKGTVCVLDDDHLMFVDIASPGTIANLRKNPGIELNVVDPLVRKGYRFKGQAEVLETGVEFDRLVPIFASRGMPDAPRRAHAIVVIRVDQARPLISPGYARGIDEASMRAHWVRHYFGEGGPR